MKRVHTLTSAVVILFAVSVSVTGTAVSAQDRPSTLRMYEVRDLLGKEPPKPVAVAKAGLPAKKGANPKTGTSPARIETELRGLEIAGVSGFLSRFVEPKAGATDSIVGTKGVVVVRGDEKIHRWVSRALSANREHAFSKIEMDRRFLVLNAGVYQNHVAPLLGERKHAVLSALQYESLLDSVRSIRGVEIVDAPRSTVRPMTLSKFARLRETTYIKDYDVDIRNASATADPVMGVVRAGISLDCKLGFTNRDSIGLDLSLVSVALTRPIAKYKTKIRVVGHPIEVDIPKTKVAKGRASIRLASGQAGLFPVVLADKSYVVAVVAVTVTPPK